MCGLKPANNSFFLYTNFPSSFKTILVLLFFDSRRNEVCVARTGGAARMGNTKARRSLAAASRAGQVGRILIWLTLFASTVVVILIFLVLIFFGVIVSSPVFDSIAAADKRTLTLRKCHNAKVLQK